LEKAAALDPKNASILSNLGGTYLALRDFDAAERVFDRALLVSPQSFSSHAFKSAVAVMARGDVSAAEKQLALAPNTIDLDGGVTSMRVWLMILEHKFSDAIQLLQGFRGEVLNTIDGSVPKAFLEGVVYHNQGEHSKAQASFQQARIVGERLVNESSEDAPRHAVLGQILAALGEKEAAISEGKRAVELCPESEDAYLGPSITGALAAIYTWTGQHEEAVRLLDHLLQVPNGISMPVLKLDPTWDPLRNEPHFQALRDKYLSKG
jgi:serine/threonine-protein kinase